MKTVCFPDGSVVQVLNEEYQFSMQCRGTPQGVYVLHSKLATHAWVKANHPNVINAERTIIWLKTMAVVQTLKPGEKAYMPGQFR